LTKFVIHQIIIRFNSVKCIVIRFQCYRSIYCFFVCLLRKSLYYAGSRNCPSWNNMPYQFPVLLPFTKGVFSINGAL
jgi:hypothetical protein